MDLRLRFLIFFLVINLTSCMFTDDDDVVVLTDANYESQLVDSQDPWLVEFYDSGSSDCKNLAPELIKAAKSLKGFVKVGAVDIAKNSAINAVYSVSSFPSIKTFGEDGEGPTDIKETFSTAEDIVGVGFTLLQQTLRLRMGLNKMKPKPLGGKIITKLTHNNFKKEVLESDDLWMVDFYAPWCDYCKKLFPHWKKAAETFEGQARFGMVDATREEGLANQFNIEGFPTIKVFPKGEKSLKNMQDYQGEDEELEGYVRRQLDPSVDTSNFDDTEIDDPNSEVVKLTAQNFEAEVLRSKDLWMIEFYAPWCGHCKALAPEWESAAKKLSGKAKLGKIDATVESKLADTYKIEGFPTIFVFSQGSKSSKPTEYDGENEAGAIYKFAMKLLGLKITEGEETKEDVITLDSAEQGATTVDLDSGKKTTKTHDEL